jgi:pyruvate-ferredoxin/flavodoxin oxidoreductase
MATEMSHQKLATETGYWPLYRYDPALEAKGSPGLRLDSRRPSKRFKEFAAAETRFAMLGRVDTTRANELMAQAQRDIDDRWQLYEQMVEIHRTAVYSEVEE